MEHVLVQKEAIQYLSDDYLDCKYFCWCVWAIWKIVEILHSLMQDDQLQRNLLHSQLGWSQSLQFCQKNFQSRCCVFVMLSANNWWENCCTLCIICKSRWIFSGILNDCPGTKNYSVSQSAWNSKWLCYWAEVFRQSNLFSIQWKSSQHNFRSKENKRCWSKNCHTDINVWFWQEEGGTFHIWIFFFSVSNIFLFLCYSGIPVDINVHHWVGWLDWILDSHLQDAEVVQAKLETQFLKFYWEMINMVMANETILSKATIMGFVDKNNPTHKSIWLLPETTHWKQIFGLFW